MAIRLAGRKKSHKRRYVDRRQRRQSQRAVQTRIDEAVGKAVVEAIERALQDEVTEILGRARSERRDATDITKVEARCNKCGNQYRRRFYRGGFYPRGILAFEAWGEIDVPRIRCVCGGVVDFEFAHLVPYGRLWFDVEERARELAGICVSLRDGVEVLAWCNGQPLSIWKVNRLVNETAVLAESLHAKELTRVPAVVMLDGVWLKILEPTDEWYTDKKGRHRQRTKLSKFPLLVAYGVDPVSGDKWLLDWERGRDEDEGSWRKLLERLLARGLHAERGLELFVHDGSAGLEKAFDIVYFGPGVGRQRCIFHKLQNVKRDVVGDEGMSRKERQQRRSQVLEDAAQVYRGKDDSEIKSRLGSFRAKWEEKEPKAVATLEREFERTLVYLKVLEKARRRGQEYRVECLRATSALERVQRHFRQKARQVVIFHSARGVEAGIQLVIGHRHLADKSTEPWAHLLEEALLVA